MKVFISHAKEKSKLTAEALASWLPQVIQAVEPWVSSSDIEKGRRWIQEIGENLEKIKVGIVCLNKDNLNEPWILFEAGAIAKTKDAYVCTFLLDLTPTDVQPPLSQFLHTKCEKEEIRKLVIAINNALGKSGGKALPIEVLNKIFDKFWPDLDESLKKIITTNPSSNPVKRPDRELLEEILEVLRSQEHSRYVMVDDQTSRGYGIGSALAGFVPASSIASMSPSGTAYISVSPSPSIEISPSSASIEQKDNGKLSPRK